MKERNVSAIGERIEQPQLDIRIPRKRTDLRVATERAGVVEQHAHPDTPIGGLEQCLDQQLTRVVALDEEVLDVERSLRGAAISIRSRKLSMPTGSSLKPDVPG